MSAPVKTILVRGVNWLGDAVMTTPALLRLREKFPDAHISILTPEKLTDLWWKHPAIDAVLGFHPEETVWQVARQLREQTFDLGIAFPNSPRSALELFLGRVRRRVGCRRPWRNWLLTQAVRPRPGIVEMRKRTLPEIEQLVRAGRPGAATPISPASHQVHHYLHLVAAVGANPEPLPPRLAVSDGEVARVREQFGFPGAASPPFIVGINAGAEYGPAKRWPTERFVAAAVKLRAQLGCPFWIFGGSGEQEAAEALAAGIRTGTGDAESVRSLAGQTTLRELCAALRACRILITNDTGPMHLAAAVGTPVVVPFGSTSPELTGPGLPGDPAHQFVRADAPCAPCYLRECPIDFRCMKGIEVDEVVVAAIKACKIHREG